jgi:hypothetical protein
MCFDVHTKSMLILERSVDVVLILAFALFTNWLLTEVQGHAKAVCLSCVVP